MSLKDIFCQDKAISILQRAFAADRMPHAYIFGGLEGVGKFKTAHEWSKLLLCKNPVIENQFADSCGSCRSCQALEAGSHPDFNPIYKELREFTKDGKNKKTPVDLPIDVIREFLIEQVSKRPTLSERKVFVVSEAEKLNAASQNCLLKVLEEPPEYCSVILLCTRMERLLATTKSRCRIIRFSPINEEKIIEKLKETGIDDQKGRYFARLGQGSLGAASQWTQLELGGVNFYEIKKNIVSSIATCQYADCLDIAQQFSDESKKIAVVWAELSEATSKTDINRRAAKTLVRIIISALHDAMKLNIAPDNGLINFDQKEQIESIAGRLGPEAAGEKIADCYEVLRWIESAVNEKLIFEHLLLNLAVFDSIKV